MLEIRPNNKNWHTRGDDTKARLSAAACLTTVSYTHLTLPTIA